MCKDNKNKKQNMLFITDLPYNFSTSSLSSLHTPSAHYSNVKNEQIEEYYQLQHKINNLDNNNSSCISQT